MIVITNLHFIISLKLLDSLGGEEDKLGVRVVCGRRLHDQVHHNLNACNHQTINIGQRTSLSILHEESKYQKNLDEEMLVLCSIFISRHVESD